MSCAARVIRAQRNEADDAKEARVQLVARVQIAYDHLRETVRRHGKAPSRSAAVRAAHERLDALNRALAMLALQAA
jgi:hypothetical protein